MSNLASPQRIPGHAKPRTFASSLQDSFLSLTEQKPGKHTALPADYAIRNLIPYVAPAEDLSIRDLAPKGARA